MTSRRTGKEAGFTLIEALVAMVILAVAGVGIIRATEAHIDRLQSLERRAAAQWAAENALAEARLGLSPAADGTVEILQWRWDVSVTRSASDDPDLELVSVAVMQENEATPLITLRGFVDQGTVTP
ncbi:MAG: type II secretion system minor pseudopilin GspI [Alteraurantiacibacter sp.]